MMIEIEKPTIECRQLSDDNTYAQFVVEPLQRGFGHTLGNSMRRILMSSLPGVAVTSIRISGVLHEFTADSGISEDVAENHSQHQRNSCEASFRRSCYGEYQRERSLHGYGGRYFRGQQPGNYQYGSCDRNAE